ncbi:hypothetical protein TrVGV298_010497 [Trichoderma virens]|nr:hypothetical protein TrVGV298_010497 [Trichoderma virens]
MSWSQSLVCHLAKPELAAAICRFSGSALRDTGVRIESDYGVLLGVQDKLIVNCESAKAIPVAAVFSSACSVRNVSQPIQLSPAEQLLPFAMTELVFCVSGLGTNGTLLRSLCAGTNLPGKESHVLEQTSHRRQSGRQSGRQEEKDRQSSQFSLGALFFLVRPLGSVNVGLLHFWWWPAAKPRHSEGANISSDSF